MATLRSGHVGHSSAPIPDRLQRLPPASPELGGAVILTGMVEWGFWFPRKFFSQWPLGGSTSPGIRGCSVQLLNRVRIFVTPRTAARQASLSITNSRSLFKLMSIESVMPYNQFLFCRPFLLLQWGCWG